MTTPQRRLLARIERCGKTGYALTKYEDRTARILEREGHIAIKGITAYPKKETTC